jgi:glycosyltransferase involved in cell wall biosynthesis
MASSTTTIAKNETWISLLGPRDVPVDGVEDYCTFLAEALYTRGIALNQVRIDWRHFGWAHALRQLARESVSWRGSWVLLQFTALAWSRRGFPFGALAVLRILHRRGARVAVVFHEPFRQTANPTWFNRIRGNCQDWVVRKLYEGADLAVFADPLATIPWLPAEHSKAAFIPIGANIPERLPIEGSPALRTGSTRTIAVFCLSDLPNLRNELADISHALKSVASSAPKIRLVFLGRGTTEAKEEIDRAFAGIPAEILNLGLLPAAEVSRTLSDSDVMLCVRGLLFPRRGSAIAGIACGLPIIAYAGASEKTPLLEAGIDLVPYRDEAALASSLSRILNDNGRWQSLHERSVLAHQKYFSWTVIAAAFCNFLHPPRPSA